MGMGGCKVLPCSCLSEEVVLPMLNFVGARGKPVSHKFLHLFERDHGPMVLRVRIAVNLVGVSL